MTNKPTMLVVDSVPECLQAICEFFKGEYVVETAATVTQALAKIDNKSIENDSKWYDVILVALQLPYVKGDILAKIIRHTKLHLKNVPIITMLAADTVADKYELFRVGITDIIYKPITKEKILTVLRLYDH